VGRTDGVEWLANDLNDLGVIANSVAAVGAVGALLVAALVYRRQAADARSYQASRIATWLERESNTNIYWWVANYSGLPVYELSFHWPPDMPPDFLGDMEVSQHSAWSGFLNGGAVDPLEAGTRCREFVTFHHYDETRAGELLIKFRDAAGHCWERKATGELREIRNRFRGRNRWRIFQRQSR
jgi:hypothetical protein